MDFNDFIQHFYDNLLPNKKTGIRTGQAFMNYLHSVWPEEYNRISSIYFYDEDNIDCFYKDELIDNTIEHLRIVWKNREDEI